MRQIGFAVTLFALLEEGLKQSGVAFSFRGIWVNQFSSRHDSFVIRAKLFSEVIGLGAESRNCLSVLLLFGLIHLILKLADFAVGLQLGGVAADRALQQQEHAHIWGSPWNVLQTRQKQKIRRIRGPLSVAGAAILCATVSGI